MSLETAVDEVVKLSQEVQRLHAENERWQWALLQVRLALGLHRDSQDDLVVVAQNLQVSHERYEYLRRLNPRQFAELYRANLRGEGAFDDLVDNLILADLVNRLMESP